MKNYYQILEVDPNASQEEIRSQYRFLVQGFHPDKYASAESKAKAEEKLKQINEAFSVLKDPVKRAQYDLEKQYYRTNSDYQAQSENERKKRQREAKETEEKRKKEQSEARRREQAEKTQREAKHAGTPSAKKLPLAIWGMVALLVLGCMAILVGFGGRIFSSSVVVPTATDIVLKIPIVVTDFFVVTETPLPVPTQIPFPYKEGRLAAEAARMIFIPEGEFLMGSDNEKARTDEKPLHKVFLSSYYIDQYEVTNAEYQRCVEVSVCDVPVSSIYSDRAQSTRLYGSPEFADYPVMYITWDMASTYCSWRGARLPTESEWEKAARGTDGRDYPWGNEKVNCTFANDFSSPEACVGDTTKVGSYESGKSPYGVYDMIGNVYEWVNDWYSDTYYEISPSIDPLGPNIGVPLEGAGEMRVLRGAAVYYGEDEDMKISVSSRAALQPDYAVPFVGFRCARSTSP